MLKSFAVAGIAALSLFSAACSVLVAGSTFVADRRPGCGRHERAPRSSDPTIAAIAAGNPNFSTLVYALSDAGLVGEFDGRPNYTVFAPTNAAFGRAERHGPRDYLKGAGLLDDVLTYHVTRGSRNSTSVLSAGQVIMLDGNRAGVNSWAAWPKIKTQR